MNTTVRTPRLSSATRHRTRRVSILALSTLGFMFATGCGTELESALSSIPILPSSADISAEVLYTCDGVLTEAQMLSSIVTARIDRANGYTKSEEELNVLTNCTIDAVFTGVAVDHCTACKYAILDQVFGE
ncbi:MAG: hypothetical protein H6817_02375 [Phycisphaerales bacterium]|nr:hypothetical protein [Phycisphaerales bacterium]